MPSTHFINALTNYAMLAVGIALPLWLNMKKGFNIHLAILLLWAVLCCLLTILVLWPLGHMLYLLIMRGTQISFREARELSPLFSPLFGSWYPVKQLKKLPKEERVPFMYWLLKECSQQGHIRYPQNKVRQKLLGLRETLEDVTFNESWSKL